MTALDQLQVQVAVTDATRGMLRQQLAGHHQVLARVIVELERKFQQSDLGGVPVDKLRLSLRAFADTGRLASLRDAQRVSLSLGLAISSEQPCLFEDNRLFPKVLEGSTGVDQWIKQPRAFRRCFSGLAASYFGFDGNSNEASSVARRNWRDLREYLHERIRRVRSVGRNPDWVNVVDQNAYALSASPYGDLPAHALAGDRELLDGVFSAFRVSDSSWFKRGLILEQVRHAVTLGDADFVVLVEKLVHLVEHNAVQRDEALALMLDRYVRCADATERKVLRDVAVEWWGNPWLPSNELHWGRVKQKTRDIVAQWLQGEFIDAFFRKLSANGVGDQRRATFWRRYIGAFTDMKFGLGRKTLSSPDPDFRALVKKMRGLYGPVDTSADGGDAFIMSLGHVVVVEFSAYSNAMYVYDARKTLPFVVREDKPLRTPVDAVNSLKHSSPRSALRLRHQDDVLGYASWEERFEEELGRHFDIVAPKANQRRSRILRSPSGRVPPEPATHPNATRSAAVFPKGFQSFVAARRFRTEDLRQKGGNLWVYVADSNHHVCAALRRMGFNYRSGKGWWLAG